MPLFFSFFRKGQFAVEYLLVTGFLFVLLLPTVYLLYTYTQQSQEQLALAQANELGHALIATAEKVYYYGKGSMLTLHGTMPSLVTQFSYRCLGAKPCEIVIAVGDNELGFTTHIPITSDAQQCTDASPFRLCMFGTNGDDATRIKASGPKTIIATHKTDDTIGIQIE